METLVGAESIWEFAPQKKKKKNILFVHIALSFLPFFLRQRRQVKGKLREPQWKKKKKERQEKMETLVVGAGRVSEFRPKSKNKSLIPIVSPVWPCIPAQTWQDGQTPGVVLYGSPQHLNLDYSWICERQTRWERGNGEDTRRHLWILVSSSRGGVFFFFLYLLGWEKSAVKGRNTETRKVGEGKREKREGRARRSKGRNGGGRERATKGRKYLCNGRRLSKKKDDKRGRGEE